MDLSIESLLKLDGLTVTYISEYEDAFKHPSMIIECDSVLSRPACPYCKSKNVYSKGTRPKDVRDNDVCGKHVTLRINSRQFVCKDCNKTFTEELPIVKPGTTYTTRFKTMLAQRALNTPFDELAYEFTVSPKTISQAFRSWINEKDAERDGTIYAPTSLGIDEAHLCPENKKKEAGMRGVFVDNENGRVLDLTVDRKKETVIAWLIQLKEPENLKIVTIDMWDGYRQAVYEVFGDNVFVVVDHFHVIKELMKRVIEVRRNIYSHLPAGTLKNHKNHLSLLRSDLDNFYDEMKLQSNRLFKDVPNLKVLFALKESFRTIYYLEDRKEAEAAFEKWKAQVPKSDDFKPFKSFINTVNKWHKEIFNYFDTDGASNATTEALNGTIKKINRSGNGYSFEVLRAKILYGAGTKSYYPIIKTIKTKTLVSNTSSKTNTMNNSFMNLVIAPSYETVEKQIREMHFGVSIKDLNDEIDSGRFFGKVNTYDDQDFE